MKFNDSRAYDGTDVESVYALFSDAQFRAKAIESSGATDVTVSAEPTDGGHTVTVVRTQAVDMPDFVKKLTGDTATVKQTENWAAPDSGGSRRADFKVSIVGQPAEMVGNAVLAPTADGVSFELNGDVKVSIPFIGKKIEPEFAKAIQASLDHEAQEIVDTMTP